jgi:glycerol-3-phosphate acyltransferase PlsY
VTAALVILGGYLLGSMPFGYWLVLLLKGDDIRKVGSGGIGASNVWRAYGRWYGIPVVLLDIAKGLVPALLGTILVDELTGAVAGGLAMLGHWRPLFLGFRKGGKAVATASGTLFGIAWLLGLTAMGLWLVTFLVTRYTSVASMVVAVALPFAALALGEPWPVIVFAVAAAVAVLLLHRPNFARLRAGTESRFRLRRGSAAT